MNNYRLLLAFSFAILFVSCAKAPFYYPKEDINEIKIQKANNSKTLYFERYDDLRINKDIDKSLSNKSMDTMKIILENELNKSSMIKEVYGINNNKYDSIPDITLSVECRRLEWSVPDYKRKMSEATAMSFGFGLIGGLAYGAQITDVNGDALFFIKIKTNNDTVGQKQEIRENVKIRESLLNCDTFKTKAKVVGLVYKKAVEKILYAIESKISK